MDVSCILALFGLITSQWIKNTFGIYVTVEIFCVIVRTKILLWIVITFMQINTTHANDYSHFSSVQCSEFKEQRKFHLHKVLYFVSPEKMVVIPVGIPSVEVMHQTMVFVFICEIKHAQGTWATIH